MTRPYNRLGYPGAIAEGYNTTENATIKIEWDKSKFTAGAMLDLYVQYIANYLARIDDNGYSPAAYFLKLNKITVPNTGSYDRSTFDLRTEKLPGNDYYFIIQSPTDNGLWMKTGGFTFINPDFKSPSDAFYPVANWITMPSAYQHNGAVVTWMFNKINAQNVKIDWYNPDGSFLGTAVQSLANKGHFNAGLPPGGGSPGDFEFGNYQNQKYIIKITSVENPNIFGYSYPFYIYID